MTTPVELVINGRDNTDGAFASAGGGLAKIGQIAAGILASQVFTKLAQAAVEFGKSVFTEAMDAQLNLAQLDAVLESTGNASGMTREQIIGLADSLSGMTRFTDDAILKGENMLLTFTNIGKDVFPQATQTILDMSTALGQDLQTSAIQLGKALNDPVQGVSALRRVGVQLSDEQEAQVKSFMAVNDIASAQNVILQELQKEFGGSAEAAGKTFAGQMDILKNKFDNLKEGLGMKLMPMIQQFADKLIKFADSPQVIQFFDDMANGIIAVLDAVSKIPDMFQNANSGVMKFITPFMPAIRSIMGTMEEMRPAIEKVAAALGEKLAAAGRELSAKVFPFLVSTMNKLAAWFKENRPLIEAFAKNIGIAIGWLADAVVSFWNVAQPLLSGFIDWIMGAAKLIMQIATGDWAGAWETWNEVHDSAWEAIKEAFWAALDWIAGLLGGSLAQIKAQWVANWNAFKLTLTLVWNIIKTTISNALNNVKGYFSSAWSNIVSSVGSFQSNLTGAISNAISTAISTARNLLGGFISIGSQIISNIVQGLRNNVSALLDYLRDLIADMLGIVLGGGGGGTPYLPPPPPNSPTHATGTNGWLTVPSGYPNDKYMVGLTSGEQYNVLTPSQAQGGRGGGANTSNYYNAHITVYTGKVDPKRSLRGFV